MMDTLATPTSRLGAAVDMAGVYRIHRGAVLAYLRRHVGDASVADDLCGQVWLNATSYADRYEERGQDIGAWLLTIARNAIIDYRRSWHTRVTAATDMTDDCWGWSSTDRRGDPLDVVERQEVIAAVHATLGGLPSRYAQIIGMRHLCELTVTETAAHLGVTETAVRMLTWRAMRAFKRTVPEWCRPVPRGGRVAC